MEMTSERKASSDQHQDYFDFNKEESIELNSLGINVELHLIARFLNMNKSLNLLKIYSKNKDVTYETQKQEEERKKGNNSKNNTQSKSKQEAMDDQLFNMEQANSQLIGSFTLQIMNKNEQSNQKHRKLMVFLGPKILKPPWPSQKSYQI